MGSITVAAWLAPLAFLALLVAGWTRGELGLWGTVLALFAAAAIGLGLPRLAPVSGPSLVTTALAVLDIVLVFIVFKGDVRIT